MKLIRYQSSPTVSRVHPIDVLRGNLDRLFDLAVSQTAQPWGNSQVPVSLKEEKASYLLRAEVPGFSKDDLTLEVTEGVLTISASREAAQQPTPEAGAEASTQARREVVLSRSLSLPDDVLADQIQARVEHGILSVILPKREEPKPRRIDIQ